MPETTSQPEPAGHLVHPSSTVARLLVGPDADLKALTAGGETVEALFTASQVEEMRRADSEALSELRSMIENAVQAASETQPSHKHRCVMIMAALGYDYGDADWLMPGDLRRLDAARARVAELETHLEFRSMEPDEGARLLGLEADLQKFQVSFEPLSEGEERPWVVRRVGASFCRLMPSYPTRWAAIRAAAQAEAGEDDS